MFRDRLLNCTTSVWSSVFLQIQSWFWVPKLTDSSSMSAIEKSTWKMLMRTARWVENFHCSNKAQENLQRKEKVKLWQLKPSKILLWCCSTAFAANNHEPCLCMARCLKREALKKLSAWMKCEREECQIAVQLRSFPTFFLSSHLFNITNKTFNKRH